MAQDIVEVNTHLKGSITISTHLARIGISNTIYTDCFGNLFRRETPQNTLFSAPTLITDSVGAQYIPFHSCAQEPSPVYTGNRDLIERARQRAEEAASPFGRSPKEELAAVYRGADTATLMALHESVALAPNDPVDCMLLAHDPVRKLRLETVIQVLNERYRPS